MPTTEERMKILKTGETVHVCEECEALWPSNVEVASTGFIDFKTYVSTQGLKGLWSELEQLPDAENETAASNDVTEVSGRRTPDESQHATSDWEKYSASTV